MVNLDKPDITSHKYMDITKPIIDDVDVDVVDDDKEEEEEDSYTPARAGYWIPNKLMFSALEKKVRFPPAWNVMFFWAISYISKLG